MVPAASRVHIEWYQAIERHREKTVPVVPDYQQQYRSVVVPDTTVPAVPRAMKVGTSDRESGTRGVSGTSGSRI